MGKKKMLRVKQLAVLDDLFGGELDESAVLERHGVSRCIYNKWMGEEEFKEEYGLRIEGLNRQSDLIMARCRGMAAAKLVELTGSEKEETARKACLDIIRERRCSVESAGEKEEEEEDEEIRPEEARVILAALVEARAKRRM